MIPNVYVSGSLYGHSSDGLVQFDARYDLSSKRELLLAFCLDLFSHEDSVRLVTQLERLDFNELFFKVSSHPDDLQVSALYSRACILYHYDTSTPKPPEHNNLVALRNCPAFFTQWVEWVQLEQYHVLQELVAAIKFDAELFSTEEAFRRAFDRIVLEPLERTSDYQNELFALSSLIHNVVNENIGLYQSSLMDINSIFAITADAGIACKLHRWWKMLCFYSEVFEAVDLKDLTGLVIVNTQLGVSDFSDYAASVAEWERCSNSVISVDVTRRVH